MGVYLMIHHHNTTVFTEAKETTTVHELNKVVEGILKRPPEEQQLYKDGRLLDDDDDRTLLDCALSSQSCCPHFPAMVGLALFRPGNGTFEPLHIDPCSSTPELHQVTKSLESGSSSNWDKNLNGNKT
ncbi:elongin-B [Podargus strigoides]